MGGTNKVEAIKDIIKSERPDILLIQETKMSDVEVLALSQHFRTTIQGNDISSRGASGGITVIFFQASMRTKMSRRINIGS